MTEDNRAPAEAQEREMTCTCGRSPCPYEHKARRNSTAGWRGPDGVVHKLSGLGGAYRSNTVYRPRSEPDYIPVPDADDIRVTSEPERLSDLLPFGHAADPAAWLAPHPQPDRAALVERLEELAAALSRRGRIFESDGRPLTGAEMHNGALTIREAARALSAPAEAGEPGMVEPNAAYRAATHAQIKAKSRRLYTQEEYDAARFAPMGDNHHNAAACPYCTPQAGARQGEDRGGRVAHGSGTSEEWRPGEAEATPLHDAPAAEAGG